MNNRYIPDHVEPQTDEFGIKQSIKIRGAPGTGKSTEALARVAQLLEEDDYSIEDVAWATYRRELADDILDKMQDWGIIDEKEREYAHKGNTKHIGTVHAISRRITDYDDGLSPVQDADKHDFLKTEYNQPYRSATIDAGKKAFAVYYWLHKNLEPPLRENIAPQYPELKDAWSTCPTMGEFEEKWDAYKDEHDLYDYHSLLKQVAAPEVAPDTDILVIDEYHDVYPLLNKVAQTWMKAADIVIVMGDTKQVINSYDGADPEYFRNIELPEAILETTYRVPESHWDVANDVIDGYHTPFTPAFESGEGTILSTFSPSFRSEYNGDEWDAPVGERYAPDWLVDRHGDDTMFLARTSSQVDAISTSLHEAGIVYASRSQGDWSDSTALNLLNAILRLREVVVKPTENGVEVLQGEDVELDEYEVTALMRYISSSCTTISSEEMDEWAKASALPVQEIAPIFGESLNTIDADIAEKLVRTDDLIVSDHEFAQAVSRYDDPIESIQTDVRTIHGSKGSEANTVVVYDGITQRTIDSISSNVAARATEDRVWYVALTRAATNLIVLRDAFEFTRSYLPLIQDVSVEQTEVTADD